MVEEGGALRAYAVEKRQVLDGFGRDQRAVVTAPRAGQCLPQEWSVPSRSGESPTGEEGPTMAELERTRRSLHGVAELVLAGPQLGASGTIRLRVLAGGFATVRTPALRVHGTDLVAGDRRLGLPGRTCAELARALGLQAGAPGNYADGSGVSPEEPLEIDPAEAALLAACWERGDAALRRLAPDVEPVLWPEHFDVGITVAGVNYGVSPGDAGHPEPYAYVGPHEARSGAFWTEPFGAARPMSALAGAEDVLAFFREGRSRAEADPVRPGAPQE